jgi:hypothetical protein
MTRECTPRLAALAVVLALAAPAPAQLPPGVGYAFPAGGRAGTAVEVKLGGYDWTPDMQFFVHDRRVRLEVLGPPGELLIAPPPYWFGARSKVVALPIPREVPARFVLPAGLPPGPVRWQVANANGSSATGTFVVGDGPEVVEDERRKGPQTLPALPVVVSGRLLKNEEVDRYRFTAPRAGPVTCVLTARRLGANFHGALEVRDESGGLVAEASDTEGLDPALTFAARPGAGYVIAVRDIDHAGDRSFVYRLALTPGPRVLAALPAAGRRGETRAVEFVGMGVATGAARLESVQRLVTFPADPEAAGFDYRLETPAGAAPPFRLFVSDLPETVLPAGGGRKDVPLSPGAVTALFDSTEGEHRYWLSCKKGERWMIAAESRRMGSPLDVALAVLGPDGKELARSDDLPGTTDAALDFTAPADATYALAVSDVAGAGGSRAAVYRLAVRRPADDFLLETPSQRVSVPIGQKTVLPVKVTRSGQFTGPITLAFEGLPPGVRVPPNLVLPADKAALDVPLEAAADAPAAAALVTLTGTAKVGDRVVTRPVRAPTTGDLAPRSPGEGETGTLIVATTLKPRCKGEPVDKDTGRKVPRGSTFPAEVTIERLGGYQGEVVLRMAAQQSYQVQGITGRDVVVPPGVSRTVYPCFMPEWLETSRTSRMAMIAVARVADPRGNVRHCVSAVEGMVTMTMEGALLKVSHHGRELAARPGRSFAVRLRVARSAQLPEPVRLELLPPEDLAGLLRAEPVVVPPGRSEVDFVVSAADDPRVVGEHTLTIRGTALHKGHLPAVSETAVSVTFSR